MFELLSGQQPFRSVEVDSLQLWTGLRDSRREPVDFSILAGRVPPAIVELLQSCLAFEIGERPRSARQLIDAIDRSAVQAFLPRCRGP